jgi:hypothetical protein
MRFTFTSPNVSEEECFNRYNNMVLKLCEDNKNEIIINSPILEKYIKENYPKYNFISSTTKCIKDMNLIRDEIKNSSYKLVCLDYNLNKNKDFLLSFTEEEREKVEFLINSICPPGCPNRKNHYELNGLFGKTFGKNYPMRECLVTNSNLYPNNYIHNFTFEEI